MSFLFRLEQSDQLLQKILHCVLVKVIFLLLLLLSYSLLYLDGE